MKTQPHTRQLKNLSQSGFAAILVTLIVVGIMTLITIGFVLVVSREGRDSLDRQLSTQAFYAAETAVNDARDLLANEIIDTEGKDDCDVDEADGWTPILSADESIQYTCVLLDFELDRLFYQNIPTDYNRPIYLNTVAAGSGTPTPIGDITLRWRSAPASSETTNLSSGDTFPSNPDSDTHPVLRITITPLDDMSREELIANTFTTFLKPTEGGNDTSVSYFSGQPADQGTIQQVDCNGMCEFSIDNLGFTNALMTVRAVYSEAELTILPSSEDVLFADEQFAVDATGKASDVLRRIQVRLPVVDRPPLPSFAIEANRICKPYGVYPGGYDSQDDECIY